MRISFEFSYKGNGSALRAGTNLAAVGLCDAFGDGKPNAEATGLQRFWTRPGGKSGQRAGSDLLPGVDRTCLSP